MNEPEETCLICDQKKNNHDDIVCDAIRAVLEARARRAAKRAA